MEKKIIDIRVIKVIDENSIVINKGIFDGIKDNMEFLIYDEGEEIFDPISGNSLGILENPKGTFKAIHVQEKMTRIVSKAKRPNQKLFKMLAFESDDVGIPPEIKIGDKVKVINLV